MSAIDLDAIEARVRARTAARDSAIFSGAPTMTVEAGEPPPEAVGQPLTPLPDALDLAAAWLDGRR